MQRWSIAYFCHGLLFLCIVNHVSTSPHLSPSPEISDIPCRGDGDCRAQQDPTSYSSWRCNFTSWRCQECMYSTDCTAHDRCGGACIEGKCVNGKNCIAEGEVCVRGECSSCGWSVKCPHYQPLCKNYKCVPCQYASHCNTASPSTCGAECLSNGTCTNGIDCKKLPPTLGLRPICEYQGRYGKYGCVECGSSRDCYSSSRPVCYTTNYTCVECLSNYDCSNSKYCDATCDPLTKTCVGQTICARNEKCDRKLGQCYECLSSRDCPVHLPECNTETKRCQQCVTSCLSSRFCGGACINGTCVNTTTSKVKNCSSKVGQRQCSIQGECVECNIAEDCGSSPAYCLNNTCNQCIKDSECRNNYMCSRFCRKDSFPYKCSSNTSLMCDHPQKCNVELGKCVNCLSHFECQEPTPYCSPAGYCSECDVTDPSRCRSTFSCNATCVDGDKPYCSAKNAISCPHGTVCVKHRGICYASEYCETDAECPEAKHCSKYNSCTECLVDEHCQGYSRCGFHCNENMQCVGGVHCEEDEECNPLLGLCVECGIAGLHCGMFGRCSDGKCRFNFLWVVIPGAMAGVSLFIGLLVKYLKYRREKMEYARAYNQLVNKIVGTGEGDQEPMMPSNVGVSHGLLDDEDLILDS